MKLSKNFTLAEMLYSPTGMRLGIDNKPSAQEIANLQTLCDNTLQPIRDLYGKSIQVNSGYRSLALNKAIGGATNSQHMEGKAADITAGSRDANKTLFAKIVASDIPFDQLIDEKDYQWIHVSFNAGRNRKQILHLK